MTCRHISKLLDKKVLMLKSTETDAKGRLAPKWGFLSLYLTFWKNWGGFIREGKQNILEEMNFEECSPKHLLYHCPHEEADCFSVYHSLNLWSIFACEIFHTTNPQPPVYKYHQNLCVRDFYSSIFFFPNIMKITKTRTRTSSTTRTNNKGIDELYQITQYFSFFIYLWVRNNLSGSHFSLM